MKSSCVMKQDSIPERKGVCEAETQKSLYHIPDLHSRYSEIILIITFKKINILQSYKHLVCT